MRPYRFGPAAIAAIAASLLMPNAAFAEDPGNGGTVSVGPVSTGPVVSKGSAGYDPNGIRRCVNPTQRVRHDQHRTHLQLPAGAIQLGTRFMPNDTDEWHHQQSLRANTGVGMSGRPDRLLRLRLERQLARHRLRSEPN